MTESPSARDRLALRLKSLRRDTWAGINVTQRQVADAFGASPPLVSSWENLRGRVIPPPERLVDYARFFATRRSLDGDTATLLDPNDLTEDEEDQRQKLAAELLALRTEAVGSHQPSDEGRAPSSFWRFAEGERVRISGSQLPPEDIGVPYANPWHPNYIRNLRNGDIDATIELYGHIRAENPAADVRYGTSLDLRSNKDLQNHVVLLGGGDVTFANVQRPATTFERFRRLLELPVHFEFISDGEPQFDMQAVVSVDSLGRPSFSGSHRKIFAPRWMPDESDPQARALTREGFPQLESDVALIARMPNPMNATVTVTICAGIFSRGTYGAARVFTDPTVREQNEKFVEDAFDPTNFWLLVTVPVFQGTDGSETLTPLLSTTAQVLMTSNDA